MEAVRELFVEQDARVRRMVRARARASEPLIEDACQAAWERLVRRHACVRRERATAWLVRTAIREAFKQRQREARDMSLEAWDEDEGDPPAHHTPPLLEELAEQRARLQSIRALNERQQRLVWLQGLGLTYDEIADEAGTTPRTVERQLGRARRKLATASA